jgi:hypothetical protein
MQKLHRAATVPRAEPRRPRAPLWPLALVGLVGAVIAARVLAGGGEPTRGAPPADEPALVLATDFGDGALQGLRRESAGFLTLDDDPLPPEQRPRAYAHHRAYGVYTSPTVTLAQPVGRVEATLDADYSPEAEVVLEVRGRTSAGRWTPWTEIEPGGAAALLDAPSTAFAYRLTLLADAVGAAGPHIRGASFVLRPDTWRLTNVRPSGGQAADDPGPRTVVDRPAADNVNPPTMRVWATREGLVGARPKLLFVHGS